MPDVSTIASCSPSQTDRCLSMELRLHLSEYRSYSWSEPDRSPALPFRSIATMQPPNVFSSYTTATPPASAFSPPAGASPVPSYAASTPRPKFLSPAPSQSIPLPHQQQQQHRSRSSGGGSMSIKDRSGVSGSLEDPVLEARRVVALLVGVSGREGEGLLGELEKGFDCVFKRWCVCGDALTFKNLGVDPLFLVRESAFEESGAGPDADGPCTPVGVTTYVLVPSR